MAEEISPLENHGWWMHQLRKDAKANRPEALRLADALEAYWGAYLGHDRERQAAAELRRLHSVNAELLEALKIARPYVSAALAETALVDAYRAERQVDIAIARAEGEGK